MGPRNLIQWGPVISIFNKLPLQSIVLDHEESSMLTKAFQMSLGRFGDPVAEKKLNDWGLFKRQFQGSTYYIYTR